MTEKKKEKEEENDWPWSILVVGWVGKTFLASFHVVQRRVVENVQFRSSTNTTFFSLVVAEATTIQ